MKDKKKGPYQKNELIEVAITDIGDSGEGIGKTEEGYTLFVKDAVIGDRIEAKITKALAHYGYGRIEQILEPSPDREVPRCPVAMQCGGCQLQALSYERQLAYKEDKVRNALTRIGGFPEEETEKVMRPIQGTNPWRYRNKMQVPVGKDSGNRSAAGFYGRHSHRIVPVTDCAIGGEEASPVLKTILSFLQSRGIPPYDEETGEGFLRHVLIRASRDGKQERPGVHICLVVNAANLPGEDDLTELLKNCGEEHGFSVEGIVLNENRERTNVILGERFRTVFGEDALTDTLRSEKYGLALTFRIAPASFYQVNPRVAEAMYEKVLDLAALTGTEKVFDLYCGIGTISLFLATKAGEVIGVEVVPEAIKNAEENAERNGIKNTRFLVGKAEEVVPSMTEKADLVVVDPPRKGCDETLLSTIVRMDSQKIIYVSCNPATLARDLRILCDSGFFVKEVWPYDQFPQTTHVETVILLCRADC